MRGESPPSPGRVLRRGWSKRCPSCGEGVLFRSWFTLEDRCGECGYRFERDPGETWGFWVILDRVFLLAPLALLAWGWRTRNWWVAGGLFLLLIVPLVATMPRRWGLCIGMEYLSRRWFEGPKESE